MHNDEMKEIKIGDVFEHIAPNGIGFGELVVVKECGRNYLLAPLENVISGNIVETNKEYRGARLFNKSTILNSKYFGNRSEIKEKYIINPIYKNLKTLVDNLEENLNSVNNIDVFKDKIENFKNDWMQLSIKAEHILDLLNNIEEISKAVNEDSYEIYYKKVVNETLLLLTDTIKNNDEYLKYMPKINEIYSILNSSNLENGPRKIKNQQNSNVEIKLKELVESKEKNDFIMLVEDNLKNHIYKAKENYINSIKTEILMEINKIRESLEINKIMESSEILKFIMDHQEKINCIPEAYRCFHMKYDKKTFNTLYTKKDMVNNQLVYKWSDWETEDF